MVPYGPGALRAQIRKRIAALGDSLLDTSERRDAVAEIVTAFEVPPYRLVLTDGSWVDADAESIQIDGALFDPADGGYIYVARVIRLIDLRERRVEHVILEVDEPYRARAIAPQLMLRSFALYDALGLERIDVHAGLQSGRFYWSGRVGFEFADERQQRQVERWATFVLGALRLGPDLAGIAEPQQWALLGTEVDPTITVSFEALAAALPPRLSPALLDPNGTGVIGYLEDTFTLDGDRMVDVPAHLRRMAEGNCIAWDAAIALGKAIMLSGPDWYGTFSLGDTVRREAYRRDAEAAIARATVA